MNLRIGDILSDGPVVMGVLNVTPDSFSDGGRFASHEAALEQVERMVNAGAKIIDVGGESSRPGAQSVSVQEELDRVIPVIEAVRRLFPDLFISVDTYKPEVMLAACQSGANMVNDIFALRQEGALEVLKKSDAHVCLMHMQGAPANMQQDPSYTLTSDLLASGASDSTLGLAETPDLPPVVLQVNYFLAQRVKACQDQGIALDRIVIDPGFGFGKTLEHNLALLRHLQVITRPDCPLLIGVSRKSMIGQLLNRPVADRLAGGLAMASYALLKGAMIVRTHDVEATVDTLKVWQTLGAV